MWDHGKDMYLAIIGGYIFCTKSTEYAVYRWGVSGEYCDGGWLAGDT